MNKNQINQLNRIGVSAWALMILMSSLFLVLYTTLFPFDFYFRNGSWIDEIVHHFDTSLIKHNSIADLVRNVLLFLPLGFALAVLIGQINWRSSTIFVTNLSVGLVLSLIVEILQVFVSARDPSLTDILANSFGALLGFFCFMLWGEKIWRCILVPAEKNRRNFWLKLFIMILAGYVSLITFISNFNQPVANLSNWDQTFPLVLGNERTGDRPWRGYISQLSFTDHALSEAEVADILGKNNRAHPFLISYQLADGASFKSQAADELDLFWQGLPPKTQNEQALSVGPDHWLEITTPTVLLNQKLAQASEFTLSTIIATAETKQEGPARLLSISDDPFQRNFMLGQENQDLVLRLRTPLTGENGSFPELAVADVFVDSRPHHLIITYKPSIVQFYIDKVEQSHHFELGLPVMLFRYLLPVDVWHIRLNTPYQVGYTVAYYSLIVIPIGFLFIYIITIQWGVE